MSYEKQLAEHVADLVTQRVVAALKDQFATVFDQATPKDMLTPKQCAERLGITLATLRQWRYRGKGPKPVKLGTAKQSAIRFSARAVDQWIAQQQRTSK